MKAATFEISKEKCFCCISIHAARDGGDGHGIDARIDHIAISIHAAREGGDYSNVAGIAARKNFNPRRP